MATPESRLSRRNKYEHVESRLDTGMSVNKLMKQQKEKNYTKKPDELFKRVRTKTLANFLVEEGWEGKNDPEKENRDEIDIWQRPETAAELIYHGLEIHIKESPKLRSYLLLDVRLQEEFETCRISGAIHYPAAMLSRSVNEFIPEIYTYKNKEKKYIIVYDDDEAVASKVASLMFQKGIDNVYMLSGGLKDMIEKFPEFVVGLLSPKLKKPANNDKNGSNLNSTSSRVSKAALSSTRSQPVKKPVVSKPSTAEPKPWR